MRERFSSRVGKILPAGRGSKVRLFSVGSSLHVHDDRDVIAGKTRVRKGDALGDGGERRERGDGARGEIARRRPDVIERADEASHVVCPLGESARGDEVAGYAEAGAASDRMRAR